MELYYYILWLNKCPNVSKLFFLNWITVKKSSTKPIKKQMDFLKIPTGETMVGNITKQLSSLQVYYSKIISQSPIEVNGEPISKTTSEHFSITIKLNPEMLLLVNSDYRSMFFEVRRIIDNSYRILPKTKIHIEKEPSVTSHGNNLIISNVLEALKNATGKEFKASGRKTRSVIIARLKEGYKFNDFVHVINNQTKKWMGTNLEVYLRPETLFGIKMESYVKAPVYTKPTQPNAQKLKNERIYNAIEEAKHHEWINKNKPK